MITGIRWLNLRRVWRQPLRSALALVAVSAGVSLTVAVLIEATSVSAATARFGRRVAGPAPLRVVGAMERGGIDEGVVDRVAHVPGVGAAVPVVQAVTVAQTARGGQIIVVAFGVDCRVQALVGPLGCPPGALTQASDEAPPALSAALARRLGPGAVVRTDTGRVSVTDAPAVPQLDGINQGRVVVFPLAVAQRRFSRAGRLDAIYVVPGPGVGVEGLGSRLAAAAGPQNAVLRSTDPPVGPDIAGPAAPLFSLVALFALGVGALLIYNIVTLSLAERRRDLAITAAVGGTARLVLGGALVEAGILGLAGGLIGVAGGVAIARPVLASVSSFTQRFVGLRVGLTVSPGVVLYGAAIGVAVALAAAVVPGRRACRLDVAGELYGREALAESAPHVLARRAVAFLAVGAVGVVACRLAQRGGGLGEWQGPTALAGVVLAMFGFFAAAGALTPIALEQLRRAGLGARGALRLAIANLVREARRTAVMALAVSIAVGMAALLAATVRSIHDASVSYTASQVGNRLTVGDLAFNDTAAIDAKTAPDVVGNLARVPGVAGVDREIFITTGHGRDLVAVVATDEPTFPYRIVAGRPGPQVFARREVLVGTVLARQRHLHPGSLVALDSPGGIVRLRVGAVWENINSTGRAVTVPMDVATSIWGPQPPDEIFLRPAAGVSASELASRVRAAHLDPDLRVSTPAQLARETSKEVSTYLTPFWVLQKGLLLVALVAVLSTLLLVGVQRRRELGTLAAVGMGPGGLARMALLEAGAVAVVASVLAGLVAIPMNRALLDGAPFFVGFRPPFRYDVPITVFYGAVALAVVLGGAVLPAWRTSRLPVLEALQYE